MIPFRVGFDSYCLHPLELSATKVLEWTSARNGEGVQFSEGVQAGGVRADEGFLRELADTASAHVAGTERRTPTEMVVPN
jgi:hypothetical protein